MARLESLARFTETPGELTRRYLTAAHKAAALEVRRWMEEAGMKAGIDAVGTVVGRYGADRPGAPALLLGSHIDTVRDAGKYDGALGVVVAIEAVARLHRAGERLPFALDVLAFGDEEGVRFPVTLTGSRSIAGTLAPATLDVVDDQGVSVREALQRFGCDRLDLAAVPRAQDEVLAYLEVHIEQGPVLEAADLPVGVVTAISGASRFTVEVQGTAGHAGTVPMRLRQDALAAAAQMVLAIERTARDTVDLVATVGRLEVAPGAVNVIPAAARFTIDVRSPADTVRRAAIARLDREIATIAAARGVGVEVRKTYDEAAATSALWLVEALEAAVGRCGLRPLRLASGAGHDGLAMAALCPIAMLFVRCRGGISHHPAESVREADVETAVRVLLDVVRHLQPRPQGENRP
jgi:allantoate deiminase